MPFLKDMWQGMRNPKEANPLVQQYAMQLLAQGGGSKGPIARMGNKLIGGLLMGGQNRAGAAQQKAGTDAIRGILAPGTGPGTLAAGPSVLPTTEPAPGGGIFGATEQPVSNIPITSGDWMPELPKKAQEMATKVIGNPLGLSDKTREVALAGVKLMESGDPRAMAIGETLLSSAISMKPTEQIQFAPDGTVWIYDADDPSGTLRKVGGPTKSTMKSTISNGYLHTYDAEGTLKSSQKLPQNAEQKIQKKTEQRRDAKGNLEKRTVEYIRDSDTHEIIWNEPTAWMPAASQVIEGQDPLAGDAPFARELMSSKIGAEDAMMRTQVILDQLNDPVYGQEIYDSLTIQGEFKNWWAGKKSKFDIMRPGDEGYEEYQRVVDFRRGVSENANLYIKEITGAQMSEAEAQRLMLAIATLTDNPAAFAAKLESSMRAFKRVQEAYDRRLIETNGDKESARNAATMEKRVVMKELTTTTRPGEGRRT